MGLGISADLYRAGSSIARGLAKRYDISRAQAGGAFADSIRALMQDDYPMTGATRPAPAIKDFVASKGKKGILSNIMDDNAMFYSPSSAKQFDNVPAGTLKSSVAKKRAATKKAGPKGGMR
jgi:hypothetical protein